MGNSRGVRARQDPLTLCLGWQTWQGRGMPKAFSINRASLDIPSCQVHYWEWTTCKDMGVALEQDQGIGMGLGDILLGWVLWEIALRMLKVTIISRPLGGQAGKGLWVGLLTCAVAGPPSVRLRQHGGPLQLNSVLKNKLISEWLKNVITWETIGGFVPGREKIREHSALPNLYTETSGVCFQAEGCLKCVYMPTQCWTECWS